MNEEMLRRVKRCERKLVKELNNPGQRITWVRQQLELSQKEVALSTGIPTTSYNEREAGVRTDYYEEFIVLSRYFNDEWHKAFKTGRFPKYEGKIISSITATWIIFGDHCDVH